MESEIKISKKELQKLSVTFRTVASRLLRTRFQEGMSNLRRFINFIENDPIIYNFIQKQQQQSTIFDIEYILSSPHIEFPIPDESDEDEVAFTYQLLRYGLNKYPSNPHGYVWLAQAGFQGKNQEKVDLFNKNLVQPFVRYIENHLTHLQIDMGEDEQVKIHIQVYGNNLGDIMTSADNQSKSINYSFGNSKWGGGFAAEGGTQYGGTLNDFSQNISQNLDEISSLIQSLRSNAQEFPTEEREQVLVHLEDLEEHIHKPEKRKPDRVLAIVTALFAIGGVVATGTDFANNVLELSEKVGFPREMIQPQFPQ
ncbi:hypothetical protein [Microcoleus sp. FACHB-68]|uniref:hypothetical protein n=1 Tax=Microcoleus sp. FACHB-68 TaxID=2692826 RepID=UPI001687E77C|nr:hypothetical protein [Microcoleus sp. FACHB-68]MBD1939646.1 hypothetical protein [Microcoleus sp. FACHB-68]